MYFGVPDNAEKNATGSLVNRPTIGMIDAIFHSIVLRIPVRIFNFFLGGGAEEVLSCAPYALSFVVAKRINAYTLQCGKKILRI